MTASSAALLLCAFFGPLAAMEPLLKTSFLLMAQYDGLAVIPVAAVVRDYFPHLTADVFLRKVALGAIPLPVVRIEPGTQKSAKGVHLADLAQYIDLRRAAAIKEAVQISGEMRARAQEDSASQ